MIRIRHCLCAVTLLAVAACQREPDGVLGTLEYDRVTLPAPLSEPIVAIDVREGQRVAAGQPLVRFESTRTRAGVDAATADAARQRAALAELQAGARDERIAQARAELAAAQAQAHDAAAYVARLQPLARQRLVARADLDRAVAASGVASGQVRAAEAALDELLNGSRREDIAQGRAAVDAAAAQVVAQTVTLDRLRVVAPRAGRVDTLPYKPGDQPPAGAPVAVLLVDGAPYARVYVREPMRAKVRVGTPATVTLDGHAPLHGTVRLIRSEPVFTPYYALAGDDASRLSWLAEIALDPRDAANLPAGLPVRATFAP